MLKGRADIDDTVAMIRSARPDVLVLDRGHARSARRGGEQGSGRLGERAAAPRREGAPGGLRRGRGLPVTAVGASARCAMTHPGYVVRVHASKPYDVLAAHTAQPAIDIDAWRSDHATLVREERRMRGPHLVVGDLNATLDHPGLRMMLADGMEDAARDANSGWQPTWPSPEKVHVEGIPTPFGLFAIDHVLISPEFSATSTSTHVVRGSDHLALIARLFRR